MMSMACAAVAPVLKVAPASVTTNLLRNADCEQEQDGRLTAWSASPDGYSVEARGGRSESKAIVCRASSPTGWSGASQTLTLQRTIPAPLVVSGWSRSEAMTGSSDSGYSIYVDIVYSDGTPLWGQTGNFRTGTHDWERVEFTIYPEKPVRSLSLHVLVRGHAGTAWFDDLSVGELSASNGAFLFQGASMLVPSPAPFRPATAIEHATGDGLRLGFNGTQVTRIKVGDREVTGPLVGGFLARDAAANSDLLPFEDNACPDLGLQIQTKVEARADHIAIEGELRDTRGQDRAIMLVFALPVEAAGWSWHDDLEGSRRIAGLQEYTVTAGVQAGSTGTLSVCPLAAVSDAETCLAVGLDMDRPALFRLAYHPGAKWLLLACDFGLAPDTEQFPGAAQFRLVVYAAPAGWGFRAALEKYMGIFPAHFEVRSREQGIWMPFTDVSRVQGWRDFGFRYHEGNNNVAFDDANGILSFRYSEPMTWWMPMAAEVARTEAEALRVRDGYAQGTPGYHQKMARVSQAAGMFDPQGTPVLQFREEPWNRGAVWSLNPNPRLPGSPNAAAALWNEELRSQLYGPGTPHTLDGEYLDSLEGYVTPDLNHRREHFRHTTVPLTFAPGTRAPALFKGLSVFEFTRWISADVHRLGRLTFANSVPYRFPYLCPWLDIMGTEVNWLTAEGYRPEPLRQLALWRSLSGRKPYLLLMNTDFERFGAYVEWYFQRCLLYGLFPSMFSHNASENPYWQNPRWYERDRGLFRKYIPVIRRLAEAGWQPVPHATVSNPAIRLERFGPDADGITYYSLYNDSATAQSGNLTSEGVGWEAGSPPPLELLSGAELRADGTGWRVELAAHSGVAIQVRRRPRVSHVELTPDCAVRLVVTDAPAGPGVVERSADLDRWEAVATKVWATSEFTLDRAWSAAVAGRFFRLRFDRSDSVEF